MIDIVGVNKTFYVKNKKVEALKNVSLHIDKGDIHGIIGYSGAGKSTLIRLINALEKPDEGIIKINGIDINKLNQSDLRKTRKKIGMIFQNFNLLNSVNVYENIAAPLKNHTGLSKSEIDKKVKELLELVDLSDKEKAYPNQLSGGQKQRVAIARALSNNPEILLCDEATSALDPNTTKSILNLIKEVKDKFNITVVLITHQMEVVKYICNKVSVMENGNIVENGNIIDIFTSSKKEITKEFVAQTIHQEGVKEKQLEIKKDFYKLSFVGENVDNPLIAEMLQKFNVTVSILYGNIEKLYDTTYGNLIVTMDGEKVEDSLNYLRSKGVIIEVIKYDRWNNI